MNFFLGFFLLISASLCAADQGKPHYVVSVCGIFQNEGPYLREWIEYHRIIGVEHFYLYNNNSDDNYMEVLAPYVKKGIVDLYEWPKKPGEKNHINSQVTAYAHCIALSCGVSDWLALIDIDEFIVPVTTNSLVTYLSKYSNQKDVGAIRINWQVFGTSNLKFLPQDRPMIESLIFKAPWDYADVRGDPPDNAYVKTIVRPEAVSKFRIHDGNYKPGFHTVPQHSKGQRMFPIQINEIRINHYWSRAEDFFYEVKMKRRLLASKPESYMPALQTKMKIFNQVQDTLIFKYLPQLKKRLAEPIE